MTTQCHCESCSKAPAETWTAKFRLECEARHLLAQPLRERREYLKPLQGERRKALEAEMIRQHTEGRKPRGD